MRERRRKEAPRAAICLSICIKTCYPAGFYLVGVIKLPKRPKKPCNYPGCPELIEPGERYCEKHKTARRTRDKEYKARRTDLEEQAFYKSWRWQRLRKWKLKQDPLCEICKAEGRITPAAIIHHIKPIKGGGGLMDVDNLMSLCKACHNRLHGANRE